MKSFLPTLLIGLFVTATTFAAPLPTSLVGKWGRVLKYDESPNGVPTNYAVIWAKKGGNFVQTIRAKGETTTITFSKNGTATCVQIANGKKVTQTGTWTYSGGKLAVSTKSQPLVSGPLDSFGYTESRQSFFFQNLVVKKRSVTGRSEYYDMVSAWYTTDDPIVVTTDKDSLTWVRIGFKDAQK